MTTRSPLVPLILLSLAVSASGETLVQEYGPFDLPSKTMEIMPKDRQRMSLPEGRLITAISMKAAAKDGRRIDGANICHNNLGPDMKDFQHGRKVLLDGYTQRIAMPKGFAMGLQKKDFLAEVMYNNRGATAIPAVTTRFELEFAPPGAKLTALYPQMMSVFEQPPEVLAGSWGYYVLPKRKDRKIRLFDVLDDFDIRHVTFHIHEHGRRIQLRNVTSKTTLADVRPRYALGSLVEMPQTAIPGGALIRKGEVLELSVDYENPRSEPIDVMGAAILFGRCTAAAPDCDPVGQRQADNKGFDAKLYYSLLGREVPSGGHHHH